MSTFQFDTTPSDTGARILAKLANLDAASARIVLGQVTHIHKPFGVNLVAQMNIQGIQRALGLRRDPASLQASYLFSR